MTKSDPIGTFMRVAAVVLMASVAYCFSFLAVELNGQVPSKRPRGNPIRDLSSPSPDQEKIQTHMYDLSEQWYN